jgi:hypothetical protein
MRTNVSVLLIAGTIAALSGTCAGILTRNSWYEPPVRLQLGAMTGIAAFEQAERAAIAAGFATATAMDERVEGPGRWGLWAREISVGEDECVALVIAAKEGDGAPRLGGMFVPGGDAEATFDGPARAAGEIPRRASPSWISTVASERFAMTLYACARRPRTVQARVLLESFDGYRPARGATATVRWEVLRRPRSRLGGMEALAPVRWHEEGVRALLAEIEDPLGLPQRRPPAGMIPQAAPQDVPEGSALLLPVSARTAAWLYRLSSGVERTVVNPRAVVQKPQDAEVIRATFEDARRGRFPSTMTGEDAGAGGASADAGPSIARSTEVPPVPHDAVMDVGRNDFRRIIAVVDPRGLGTECVTLTLARDQGLFSPRLQRRVFDTSARTARTFVDHTEEHVVTDRVCPDEGVVVYAADAADAAGYRVSVWQPAPTLPPAPTPRAPRPRAGGDRGR